MLEKDGKLFARVSEIISPFADFSGIDSQVLLAKASIGTDTHKAIKEYLDGDFPLILPKNLGYFQSFHKWFIRLQPVFLESEVRYYDDQHLFTGCIDGFIKLENEKKGILIDFKTSVQENPVTWAMQAHFYRHLLEINGKDPSPRMLFIKLDRWGDFPTVIEYKFDRNTWAKCLQATKTFWDSKRDST